MSSESEPRLRLYNSLSRQLEDFRPRDPEGRYVTWYSCGPTVYDASHMGHARSYISFDILRRVLQNYFNYDVFFVMNVTDIDDKIIKRARQEHLFRDYSEGVTFSNLKADMALAFEEYVEATVKETDPDKKLMRERTLERVRAVIREVDEAVARAFCPTKQDTANLVAGGKDILFDFLDKRNLETRAFSNEIFERFARYWENEYFMDMEALNVLPPNVLTRVSEYVEEIVDFIKKIQANGYAYESNGSVYFDVAKYRASPDHKYAKLVPEAVGDEKMLMEGEGELTSTRDGEKKSAADFALWKASRKGEPSWKSPWGSGRPGWHIECSAMASAIVGAELDIHTGGVDLKFPHHDNEIAQSEAYFESNDWVRYFLHSGHLTIAGCKMSKSLKNFITIKEALKTYTAAQLRMTFLLHSWKDTLDYSPQGMETAVQTESKFNEFFLNVKDCMRTYPVLFPKWKPEDISLQKLIDAGRVTVHKALCDNIDTKSAMIALRNIISACNVYIQNCKGQRVPVNAPLLRHAAQYVHSILKMFGVVEGMSFENIGAGNGEEVDMESLVFPFLKVLSDFREGVREAAKSKDDDNLKGKILTACDDIRDVKLPDLGVRLEDHEGCPTVVKFVGKEAILREREQKEKLEKERALEKQRKKDEAAKAQMEKEAQKRIPPQELFRKETDKYSQFNDDGLPTHDKEGNPITKSQLKKLEKLWNQQKKNYEDFLKSQQS